MRKMPELCTGGYLLFVLLNIFVLFLSNFAWGNEEFKPVYKPTLNMTRVQGEINIDGKLNDAGWKNAGTIDQFVENYPGDQIKPPVETKVFITYDNDNLYVAFLCYDNPEDIRASLCERDMINSDDNVMILIDPYGNGTMAYFLKVNPYGIQGDDLYSVNYGQDVGYDLIWESDGQITDSGYQVEMAVPFSSMRFPKNEKQTWRVDFWRNHRRGARHKISWAPIDRSDPCWLCQWGTLTGLEDVSPGKGIEIIASATATQSGKHNIYISSLDPQGFPIIDSMGFENNDIVDEYSLGVKYNISSNITSEIFINPDFSQVEADADQIDVNSTTALYFPEKRPFFQEGSDLFRTSLNIVHTRMINDPFVAAKTTARLGKISIAYLAAMDERSPVIMPFEESSSPEFSADTSFSNILRISRSLSTSSYAGLLLTDRRFKQGGSGTAVGLDGKYRFAKNFQFDFQGVKSFTREPDNPQLTRLTDFEPYRTDLEAYPYYYQTLTFDDKHTPAFDGEDFSGYGAFGQLRYEARDFSAATSYNTKSPTYRADNGFSPRNNSRNAAFAINYTYRFESNTVEYMQCNISTEKEWNHKAQNKGLAAQIMYEIVLKKAQTHFLITYMRNEENFQAVQFDDMWRASLHYYSIFNDRFSCGLTYEMQKIIARSALTLADSRGGRLWMDFKPIDRLLIENNINFTKAEHADTKEELWDGYIVRSKISLNLNRELSFRFVTQYNDFGKTWDFDPLITYKISPFSLFYIGSTFDYNRLYLDENETIYMYPSIHEKQKTILGSRQFFMKLQYLFQI